MKVLMVGGAFSHDGGKASSIIRTISNVFAEDVRCNVDLYNGITSRVGQ